MWSLLPCVHTTATTWRPPTAITMGLGLSEVLFNFGDSARDLGDTITVDYQREADSAYLNKFE
jgi:hypothetical protein